MIERVVVVEIFGREVKLAVAEGLDRYGQFRVALSVDDKERYACNFTDKSGEVVR